MVSLIDTVIEMMGLTVRPDSADRSGPLLFHFQPEFGATSESLSRMDQRFQESVEPSIDDITRFLSQIGFEIERVERGRTTYCNNARSGMKVEYQCHLIVAKKI